MRLLSTFLAFSFCTALARGEVIDFSPVTDPVTQFINSRPAIAGAGLYIADFQGNTIHEQYWGNYDRNTTARIGSATKIISAGVLMSLVDDGKLGLDQKVSEILPSFGGRSDGKSDITIRQLFTHTSGLPGDTTWVNNPNITLQAAANGIAQSTTMLSAPGTNVVYGGTSMHVAGAAAEIVSGMGWANLFNVEIATPLGMTQTDFLGVGTANNPRIAGGIRTSIADLSAYMQMIGNNGVHQGQRILSENAINTMLRDQTNGAAVSDIPAVIDPYLGYGIGNWVDRKDSSGKPIEFSSPGAFGTTPWLNIEKGYYGIFFVDNSLANFDSFTDNIREFARENIATSVPEPGSLHGVILAFLSITLKRRRKRLGLPSMRSTKFKRKGDWS
jgi:CubicO group peptidase (beta-lactamase class C family)